MYVAIKDMRQWIAPERIYFSCKEHEDKIKWQKVLFASCKFISFCPNKLSL